MEAYDGTEYVAKYSTFKVGSQAEGYVLTLDGFSSTPTFSDAFKYHNGSKFSAKDKDQDNYANGNCALIYNGGWWNKSCLEVKFTGLHFEGSHAVGKGIHWDPLIGYDHSMKKVSMKVRRKVNNCQP